MVRHTFFDKCCTIFKDSDKNTGLNPVAELNYGDNVSRVLIHFDVEELKSLYDDKTFCNLEGLKHILKMTNCGSVNNDIYNSTLFSSTNQKKERATSFDILLFKVPNEWDNGKGVDFASDFWVNDYHVFSNSGCNWFQRVNGGKWENEGIYTSEQLSSEYEKYSAGKESVIIARQHFDIGNENFEFDITEYVNNLILGKEKNFGLCLCFTPLAEMSITEYEQYVGFFGPYTNTFFHPYLETTYNNVINDNRDNFHIGKTNRLYLYCHEDDVYMNLDELPSCTIEGIDEELIVKQHSKGVYYTEFSIKKGVVGDNTILYDTWSNLSLNGEKMDDQEFEFVVCEEKNRFNNKTVEKNSYIPSLSGIRHDEVLEVGEVREVSAIFRKKFTTNVCENLNKVYYRLYVKDGSKEINVIDYHPIDKKYLISSFTINTNDLVPNDYFIDIKQGSRYYRDVLRFTIVSNKNNNYF